MKRAAVLVLLLSTGCVEYLFGPTPRSRPSSALDWDCAVEPAVGVGRIVTFDDDKPAAEGWAFQVSVLLWGFRFMDFDYEDENTGATYTARSYLAYVGSGTGRGPHSTGWYLGYGGGVTRLRGPGVDDLGLTGTAAIGVCKYHDFESHGGAGLAAEAGLFVSAPEDVSLSGLSLILGGYLYF